MSRDGLWIDGVGTATLVYGIRGAIWYQGESNAGRAHQYRQLFPLMISNWRDEWGQGDFPFYWVQLADFRSENAEPGESSWVELREAQTMTMDKLANTGEAVIIDTGEGYDIHQKTSRPWAADWLVGRWRKTMESTFRAKAHDISQWRNQATRSH